MTTNPLISARGFQYVRCNGDASVPIRPTLHLVGADVTDDVARNQSLCDVTRQIWIALYADLEPFDGIYRTSIADWFGVSLDFQAASDCYINPTGPNVIIAQLAPPTASGTMRKRIINTSAVYPLQMTNNVGGTEPGYLMGLPRPLAPGEACRALWDPVGLRWLINCGLQSANYVTQFGELVTYSDDVIEVDVYGPGYVTDHGRVITFDGDVVTFTP